MKLKTPIAWFEIVVKDMQKAISFYQNAFGYTISQMPNCPSTENKQIEMAIFAYEEGFPSGSLVCSSCYDDHKNGPSTTIIYLTVESISRALEKIQSLNAKVTFPCTSIGENGFIAGFEDLDGNEIGIWSENA